MSLRRELSKLHPEQLNAGVNVVIGGIGDEPALIGDAYPSLAATSDYIETVMRNLGHDDETINNILMGVTLGFAAIAGPTIFETPHS